MFISFALKILYKFPSFLTKYCYSRLFLDTGISATAGVCAISGIVADAAFLSAISHVPGTPGIIPYFASAFAGASVLAIGGGHLPIAG